MMQPGEKSFDSPTSAVATQRATILASPSALSAMRCDHFDAIALGQLSIQAVTVVGFVADQSCKVPQVRARVLGANLDWIRAKTRFELSMLLVRTKTAGQKGAFAHDDYRM